MNFELSELSFDDIGSWPKPVKIFSVALASLLIVGLAYWFDTKPQLFQLTQADQKEAQLRQDFETKFHLAVNIEKYRAQLETIRTSFSLMLRQLPINTAEVPALLEDISKSGVASGLEFKLFDPMPEKQLDFYAELPINMTVVGNYHQLAQFVDKVSKLDRIVTLHDFFIEKVAAPKSLSKADGFDGDLIMHVTAKTYRYTENAAAGMEKT